MDFGTILCKDETNEKEKAKVNENKIENENSINGINNNNNDDDYDMIDESDEIMNGNVNINEDTYMYNSDKQYCFLKNVNNSIKQRMHLRCSPKARKTTIKGANSKMQSSRCCRLLAPVVPQAPPACPFSQALIRRNKIKMGIQRVVKEVSGTLSNMILTNPPSLNEEDSSQTTNSNSNYNFNTTHSFNTDTNSTPLTTSSSSSINGNYNDDYQNSSSSYTSSPPPLSSQQQPSTTTTTTTTLPPFNLNSNTTTNYNTDTTCSTTTTTTTLPNFSTTINTINTKAEANANANGNTMDTNNSTFSFSNHFNHLNQGRHRFNFNNFNNNNNNKQINSNSTTIPSSPRESFNNVSTNNNNSNNKTPEEIKHGIKCCVQWLKCAIIQLEQEINLLKSISNENKLNHHTCPYMTKLQNNFEHQSLNDNSSSSIDTTNPINDNNTNSEMNINNSFSPNTNNTNNNNIEGKGKENESTSSTPLLSTSPQPPKTTSIVQRKSLLEIKKDIVFTIRNTVEVIVRSAGTYLPADARIIIRRFILSLPTKLSSRLSQKNINHQLENGSFNSVNDEYVKVNHIVNNNTFSSTNNESTTTETSSSIASPISISSTPPTFNNNNVKIESNLKMKISTLASPSIPEVVSMKMNENKEECNNTSTSISTSSVDGIDNSDGMSIDTTFSTNHNSPNPNNPLHIKNIIHKRKEMENPLNTIKQTKDEPLKIMALATEGNEMLKKMMDVFEKSFPNNDFNHVNQINQNDNPFTNFNRNHKNHYKILSNSQLSNMNTKEIMNNNNNNNPDNNFNNNCNNKY